MNSNDLKIFEAVASTGSFTKAAATTFTVQSNVTARIRSLEDEFGAPLFIRSSRRVELSQAGQIMMQYSRQIIQLVEEAKNNIKSSKELNGILKVGCIETTMALKAPQMLTSFEKKYPMIDLEFSAGLRGDLINKVLNYNLDAAFVPAPVNVAGLDQKYFSQEKLVLVSASADPKLIDNLSAKPLKIIVFDEGCVFRARLESWLSSKGIIHYKSIVLNSIDGIINFVEAGLGISLLPEEVILQYYSARKLFVYPLSKQLATMNTVLIYRKDFLSRALKAFLDFNSVAHQQIQER